LHLRSRLKMSTIKYTLPPVTEITRSILALALIALLFACGAPSPDVHPVTNDLLIAARVDSLYNAGTALIREDYDRARPLVQSSFELGYANGQDSLVGMRKVKIATYEVYLGNIETGKQMLREVRSRAEENGPGELLVNVYSELIQVNEYYGEPDSVDYYLERILSTIDTVKAPNQYANYLRRRAEVLRLRYEVTASVRDYTRALAIYDKHANSNIDSSAIAGILIDLAVLLSYTGSFEKAFPYFKRALRHFVPGQPGYAYGAARVISTATALGENEYAEARIAEVLNQTDASPSERYLAVFGIAQVAYSRGQYQGVIDELTMLEDMQTDDPTVIFETLKFRASALLHLNQPERLQQAVDQLVNADANETQKETADLIARKAAIVIDGGPALLGRLEELLTLQDSFSRKDQFLALANMEVSYRSAVKDREIAEAEVALTRAATAQRQFQILGGMGLLIGLGLLAGLILYRRNNRRLEVLNERLKSSVGELDIANESLSGRNEELDGLNVALADSKSRIEVLNEELNHRVKNNLAFMSSVFQMQSRRTESEEAKELLTRMESRIETLNAAHELMQNQVNDKDQLSVQLFFDNIAKGLQRFYATDEEVLEVKLDIANIDIPNTHLIRLGLIANELTSNTVKHTLSVNQRRVAFVKIASTASGGYQFVYQDQGTGIPDWRQRETVQRQSLGTKLIDLMVGNIGGGLKIGRCIKCNGE